MTGALRDPSPPRPATVIDFTSPCARAMARPPQTSCRGCGSGTRRAGRRRSCPACLHLDHEVERVRGKRVQQLKPVARVHGWRIRQHLGLQQAQPCHVRRDRDGDRTQVAAAALTRHRLPIAPDFACTGTGLMTLGRRENALQAYASGANVACEPRRGRPDPPWRADLNRAAMTFDLATAFARDR